MTLQEVHSEVQAMLNSLRPLFIDDAELTFIMRVPGKPAVFMVITNDNLSELAKLLEGAE